MRTSSSSLILFLLWILFSSCSGFDESDLDAPPRVVVDGFIEQGRYPIVYLTYSSGFYAPVDSASLQELVLTSARVEISDGEESEVLTLFKNNEVYPPFYYGGTDIRGEAGKTYTLEVTSRQGIYTASTTIPMPVELDSIWIDPDPEQPDLGNLWIRFQDDGTTDNYYRHFARVWSEGQGFKPSYQSTLFDVGFDGTHYSHPILRLPESFLDIGDDVLFNRGDTITVKFCTIDRAHFDFWRALERELYLVGNPFGSTGNDIPSNVSGNRPVLGIWGGYGVTYKTVIFR